MHSPQRQPLPRPRALCFGAPGRLDAQGTELEPLGDAALDAVLDALLAAKPAAVAINFLFSWKNAAHEVAAEARLRARLENAGFDRALHQPKQRNPCRSGESMSAVMATWLNASLSPKVRAYLERLGKALGPTRLDIMASHGGTLAPAFAASHPVQLLLSGPAGGVAGVAAVSQALAVKSVPSFDMGGTSTDVALVDGSPQLSQESRIGPYPVAVPMLAVHTIGAGGGSIASLDEGGALQVGPASAGASPGPAQAGKAARRPRSPMPRSCSGACPRIRPSAGTCLQDDAARTALGPLATALGCSPERAAEGILAVANDHMAQALRVMSLERGIDPRQCVLASFGGLAAFIYVISPMPWAWSET